MSDRKLAVLAVLAVLFAGAAVLLSRVGRDYTPPQITLAPLIEGFDVERIQTIAVGSKDSSEGVHLDRSGKGFAVREKDNYPAVMSKVNSLISDCLDIRITSDALITSNPANHAEIGVTPETAQYRVEFLDAEQKPIVGLLISEPKSQGEQGSFSAVRRLDRPEVYRLNEPPYVSVRPMDYIETQILQVEREQIARVMVTDPNQRSYTLTASSDSSDLLLEPLPADKQVRQANAKTTFTSLTYLRIEDVMAASKAPSVQFDWSYVCELKNHLVYTVRLAKQDGKCYVRLSARYTGPEPQVQQKEESEEQLKEREALFLARDTAESFTAKHSGWVYVIPSYKGEEMTRPLEDLAEDKPAPASASPAAEDGGSEESPVEAEP